MTEKKEKESGGAQVIDERRFWVLADSVGDSTFLKEMVMEFLEELPAKFKDFPDKLAGGQFEEIARECHKYKSTSGIFGMEQLSSTLLLLEKAAQERDPVEIKRMIVMGSTDLDSACISVAALLAKN